MNGEWRVPGFTEVHELGAGAQGRAVLVRQDRTGKVRVLKYVEVGGVESLRRESVLLKRVSSPHVARWHGHFEDGAGSAAILMEAVDGCSLKDLLAEHGALTPEAALVVLKGSLLGLGAAHKAGVVHRDYKPANIVVEASGRSKLIDFGVAVPEGVGSRAGTPSYMAPEQWKGEPSTPATDIYAATCVFFQCVTGRPPYAGDTLAEVRAGHMDEPVPVGEVPEELRGLVLKGLAKQTAERHENALRFAKELERTARATYGRGWERRGAVALGGAAAALASLSPLLGGGVVTAAQTTTTSLLAAGAGKVAPMVAAVVTGVITVGAGAFFVAQADKPAPAPSPERIVVALQQSEESFTEPRPLTVRASYVRVSGMRDRKLQELINERLAAPIKARIVHIRDELEKRPANSAASVDTITAEILLRNAGVLSVRYDFLLESPVLSHPTWNNGTAANVSMKTGHDFSGPAAFRSDLDLAGLDRRLRALAPGGGFCRGESEPPGGTAITRESLETTVHPAFTPDLMEIEVNYTGLGYFTFCGREILEMSYADAADILNPDLLPLLPAKPSSPAGTPTGPLSLGPDGYGAVKLGMTLEQAEATGQIVVAEGEEAPCSALTLKRSPGAKSYASISPITRTIALIYAVEGMSTPEGITLGSSLSQVKKAYPDSEPNPDVWSVEVPGHDEALYLFRFGSGDFGGRDRLQELLLVLPEQGCVN